MTSKIALNVFQHHQSRATPKKVEQQPFFLLIKQSILTHEKMVTTANSLKILVSLLAVGNFDSSIEHGQLWYSSKRRTALPHQFVFQKCLINGHRLRQFIRVYSAFAQSEAV